MKEIKFEQAMARLEKIVENLEEGELSLEEALQKFEEGIGLSRFCAKKLDEAQEKVDILLSKGGEGDGAKKPQPFQVQPGGDTEEE